MLTDGGRLVAPLLSTYTTARLGEPISKLMGVKNGEFVSVSTTVLAALLDGGLVSGVMTMVLEVAHAAIATRCGGIIPYSTPLYPVPSMANHTFTVAILMPARNTVNTPDLRLAVNR